METFAREVTAIQTAYPNLEISSVEPNLDGQYNTVLLINDELIFRFPRFAAGLEQLQLETKILTAVHPHISLQIPNPTFVHLDTAVLGGAFMGYPKIAGEGLWPRMFKAIQDLIDEPLPLSDGVDEWEDVYGRIEEKLFPYMRLDAAKSVADHFDNYFATGFDYQPCLRHGDFGTGNILYDSAQQRINGIIDFGFTVLGDPAFDFAGLLTYGEPFVQRMSQYYPALESYWERIRFYRDTFALFDALYGIENDVPEAFEAGMVDYV